MKLKTAIRLLSNGNNDNEQLFFGDVLIYKNGNLVISAGLGIIMCDNLHEQYLNDDVSFVVWNCHGHVWEIHLRG